MTVQLFHVFVTSDVQTGRYVSKRFAEAMYRLGRLKKAVSCLRKAAEGKLEGTRKTVAELTERLAAAEQQGARTTGALREAMAAQAERAETQRGQLEAALEEARAEQLQLREALDEASGDGERAVHAHEQQLAALHAQLQALQSTASQAQGELRAERERLAALEEEAALARQGLADLEAILQQERSQHEETAHKVPPVLVSLCD